LGRTGQTRGNGEPHHRRKRTKGGNTQRKGIDLAIGMSEREKSLAYRGSGGKNPDRGEKGKLSKTGASRGGEGTIRDLEDKGRDGKLREN